MEESLQSTLVYQYLKNKIEMHFESIVYIQVLYVKLKIFLKLHFVKNSGVQYFHKILTHALIDIPFLPLAEFKTLVLLVWKKGIFSYKISSNEKIVFFFN